MVRIRRRSWQRRRLFLKSVMGSSCSCIRGDREGPVLWYQPGTNSSLAWCRKETGFGYRRKKSYLHIAIGETVDMDDVNRIGNFKAELAGRIVTYEKASKRTDYSEFSECPTFNLGEGEKLFAKAFLPAPLTRIPIGENNIAKTQDLKGRGATLLAPIPQAIAIFLDIDGKAQCHEHYCQDSLNGRKQEFKEAEQRHNKRKVRFKMPGSQPDDPDNSNEDKKELLEKAVTGSFYTFLVSEGQYPFCFLHLPLIGNLHDTNISTGYYGENFIRCFCDVIKGLPPGIHKFDLRVCLCFDHMEYNYLVLGVGTNALGRWGKRLSNSLLKEPYANPEMLVCSRPIATGSFYINVLKNSNINEILSVLDRRPPPEKYHESDRDKIRKVARTVAAGKYCEIFNVSGLPDWVVLSSGKITKTFNDQGRRYSYTVIEYVALWLNDNDVKPDATGTMVEGAMAKGEIRPGSYTEDWVWTPRVRHNHKLPIRSIGVKNKFINIEMKGRKFSVFSTKFNSCVPMSSRDLLSVPTMAWGSKRSVTESPSISEEDEESTD